MEWALLSHLRVVHPLTKIHHWLRAILGDQHLILPCRPQRVGGPRREVKVLAGTGRVSGSTGKSPTASAAQLSRHRGEQRLCQEVGTPLPLGLSRGRGAGRQVRPILSGVELSLDFAVAVVAVSTPPASP